MKRRQESLARFNRWEAANREKLPAAQVIRRIFEIYDMLPEAAKKKDLTVKLRRIREILDFQPLIEEKLDIAPPISDLAEIFEKPETLDIYLDVLEK